MPSASRVRASFRVFASKTSASGSWTAPSGLVALCNPPAAIELPIRRDRQAAHAAEVDLLPAFVGVQGLGVEAADRLPDGEVPFLDHAQQDRRSAATCRSGWNSSE